MNPMPNPNGRLRKPVLQFSPPLVSDAPFIHIYTYRTLKMVLCTGI